jgi:hypothetical protein
MITSLLRPGTQEFSRESAPDEVDITFDSEGLEVALRCVRELRTVFQEGRFWFMRTAAGGRSVRVGIELPNGNWQQLLDFVEGLPYVRLVREIQPKNSIPSILARLPFAVPEDVSGPWMDTFRESCLLSVRMFDSMQDYSSAPWIRLKSYVQIISSALDRLPLSMRQTYCHFHYSWIIRFVILRAGKADVSAEQLTNLLVERVRPTMEKLESETPLKIPQEAQSSWLSSIERAHSESLREEAFRSIALPFGGQSPSVVLMQSFHALAHVMDVEILQEALAFMILHGCSRSCSPIILTRPSLESDLDHAESTKSSPGRGGHPPWMVLVKSSHHSGNTFLADFEDLASEAYGNSERALMLLRQHHLGADRLDGAARLLASARDVGLVRAGVKESVKLLLERFLLATEAYYHYCSEDLDTASRLLDSAQKSLESAIDREECLMGCAPLNADIPLQRARIARKSGDWECVAKELTVLANLETCREPLYRRIDGLSIDYDVLAHRCASGGDLSEGDRHVIREFTDPSHRISRLNRWIRSFYLPKGLFIIN